MSLSDRLAQAARQRQGVPTVEAGSGFGPPAQERRDLTIVLHAHIPAAAVEPDLRAAPGSVCPTCGRTGELGLVDLPRHTQDWSCAACGTVWRVTVPAVAPDLP